VPTKSRGKGSSFVENPSAAPSRGRASAIEPLQRFDGGAGFLLAPDCVGRVWGAGELGPRPKLVTLLDCRSLATTLEFHKVDHGRQVTDVEHMEPSA